MSARHSLLTRWLPGQQQQLQQHVSGGGCGCLSEHPFLPQPALQECSWTMRPSDGSQLHWLAAVASCGGSYRAALAYIVGAVAVAAVTAINSKPHVHPLHKHAALTWSAAVFHV